MTTLIKWGLNYALNSTLPYALDFLTKTVAQDPKMRDVALSVGMIGTGAVLIQTSGILKPIQSWIWNTPNPHANESWKKTALRWSSAFVGAAGICYGVCNLVKEFAMPTGRQDANSVPQTSDFSPTVAQTETPESSSEPIIESDDSHLSYKDGMTPSQIAFINKNFDLIKYRFRGIRAFDACKDIHDFAAVLYPPYKDSLPPNWERVVSEIPHTLSELEQEERFQRALGIRFPTSEEIVHRLLPENKSVDMIIDLLKKTKEVLSSKTIDEKEMEGISTFINSVMSDQKASEDFPIKTIFQTLFNANPLYAKAWELSGQPGIQIGDHELGKFGGSSVHGKGLSAASTFDKIYIGEKQPLSEKLSSLVFETINVAQRNSVAFVTKGDLDRESFALGKEWIELKTSMWAKRILENQFAPIDFLTDWIRSNQPYNTGSLSHADFYRRQWDQFFLNPWIHNRPDLFQKRLEELALGSQG